MPQYQIVDWGPNPTAQAATNLGQGFYESLKRGREQEFQNNQLEQILYPNGRPKSPNPNLNSNDNPANPPNPNGGPAYLGNNSAPPDNITPAMNNIANHPDTLAKQGIVSGQNPQHMNTTRLTPEKMAQIQLLSPKLAKALQPVYESQSNREKEGVKADVKRSAEFLTKMDHIRDEIQKKEASLRQIEQGVAGRDNLDFAADQLASITGMEIFRSAKGAQLISAAKEFFISDLNSIPGAKNMLLEKNIMSALTDPLRKDEANELVISGMRAKLKREKVKSEIADQYEEHYRNTLGYIPASISKDVDKAMIPYAQKIGDQQADEAQHIFERHNPQIQKFAKVMNDPDKRKIAAQNVKLKPAIPGSVLDETMGMILLEKYGDDEAKAMEVAKKLGYTIPGMQ